MKVFFSIVDNESKSFVDKCYAQMQIFYVAFVHFWFRKISSFCGNKNKMIQLKWGGGVQMFLTQRTHSDIM